MSWSLVLVAAASVLAVLVLAALLQRVCNEVALLRLSLRRARAAGVANDELAHQLAGLEQRLPTPQRTDAFRRMRARRNCEAS